MKFRWLAIILLVAQSQWTLANTLVNVSQDDVTSIATELGAGFKHSSVGSVALPLEGIRYEVGLVSGNGSSGRVRGLFAKAGSDRAVPTIPRAGVLGGVSFAQGFGAEFFVMPKVGSIFTLESSSIAGSWDFSKYIPSPFQFKTKLYYGSSKASWSQFVSGFESQMNYAQNSYGLDVQASRTYGVFSPYLNLGYISNTGTLKSTAAGLFQAGYTAGESSTEAVSGASYGVGLGANLALMNFSVELLSTLGTSVASFKASANF